MFRIFHNSKSRKVESSRTFLFSFSTAMVAGIVILLYLQAPSDENLFNDAVQAQRFLEFSERDMLNIKRTHAVASEPFNLGLFGNSRSVAVGRDDLAFNDDRRFFNYSVPGTSFRTSVSFLEFLVAEDVAPNYALVSIDNFALGYFGPEVSPDRFERFLNFFKTARLALPGSDVDGKSGLRATWRQIWLEYTYLKQDFSFQRLKRLFSSSNGNDRQVRIDGSVPMTRAEDWSNRFPAIPAGTDQIILDLLKYDLSRLAMLQSSATPWITIYESPLHPDTELETDRSAQVRRVFRETCSSLGLNCRTIDDYPMFAANSPWPDGTHAPPVELGALLRDFLPETGRQQ